MFSLLQEDSLSASEYADESQDISQESEDHCGLYQKGFIIETKLVLVQNIDSFFFYTKQLDDQQRELIKSAPEFSPLARPYTTKPGDIKIFASDNVGHRCRILDIYSYATYGQFQVYTEIFLIDEAKFMKNINLSNIYDLPQSLDGVEPETIRARLGSYLGDVLGADEFFLSELKATDVKLKIVDYKDGLYSVDILQENGSMVDKLVGAFRDKVQSPLSDSRSFDEDSAIVPDFASTTSRQSQVYSFPRKIEMYRSAKQFFISHLKQRGTGLHDPELGKYLFRVKLVYWYNPRTIYLIPDYHDYFESHTRFRDILDGVNSNCAKDETNIIYHSGQICFIKNEFERKLGKWLRGIVLNVPTIKSSSLFRKGRGRTNRIPISLSTQNADKLIYRVRSIDFGFELLKSSKDLRPVRNYKLFYSKGSWALGCRLFGVHPQSKPHNSIAADHSYSDICIDMIDSWIRERTQSDVKGLFYAVFQSRLDRSFPKDLLRPHVDITLFHRFDSEKLGQAKRYDKYSCLNTFLVEGGYASQYDILKKTNSNILLSQTSGSMVVNDYK